ncbi:MAG: hypothetical protein J6K17_09745 [Oscillospiraceae bacterium]|nr:hypothetical protein [Oscillospiraceae bacterium]
MIFIICFSIAAVILAVTAIRFFRNTENKLLTTGAGLFLALFALFFPSESCASISDTINTIIISIVRSIKVFGLNEDFFASEFDFGTLPLWFNITYVFVLNLLYLIAPLLTFGLILSIFGNISSGIRLALSGMKDVYIFSSANTRSTLLAEDIKKHNPDAVIVFYNSENTTFRTRNDIICFSGSISEINPIILKFAKHITLFICDNDEAINLNNAIAILSIVKTLPKLTEKLKTNSSDNTGIDLYFFTSLKKAGPLLNGIDDCGVRVRRINEIQNLVYNFIYEKPVLDCVNENKEINLAVIGMGQYGEEYLKAALWSGQHLDYKLNINVFDIRNIRNSFAVKCPELVNTELLSDNDEINYKINFFDGQDIFEAQIEAIPEMKSVTAVFVALGDDEKNFEAAIYLRECFERMETKPEIHTVMSHIDFNGNNQINITNHKHQAYDINFILPDDIYTYEKIMNTELEKMGKKMFSMWNGSKQEEDFSAFYDFEFNYRSSISASMFWKIRKSLGLNVEVTEENKQLEHRRWNAYMRTEGFRYSKNRNDIAKTHPCLVPYDKLDVTTKNYDEYPIISVFDGDD